MLYNCHQTAARPLCPLECSSFSFESYDRYHAWGFGGWCMVVKCQVR